MEKFGRWQTRFFILTLLVCLLPLAILASGAWWAITSPDTQAQEVFWPIAGVALGAGLLLALSVYVTVARPLSLLSRHIEALSSGDATYRSVKRVGGFWGSLAKLMNKVSDRVEQYSRTSRTELDVITAEANRLRNIINAINDGVIALDKDAHILLFNKAAARISGFSYEEAAGRAISAILPLLKGNSLVLNDWLVSVDGTDLRNTSWENLRLKTKDGKTRSVDAEVLYQGADPNGVRTLLTFHDRTQAQELEDMKVDFVALAAHELRTPISVIRGYLEILEDEMGSKLTPEEADFMRKLTISSSQLSGFINNILHVSRIEHGDLNLKLEAVDWVKLVKDVAGELGPKAEVQGKKLAISLPAELPEVAVDKMSIVEVINNLVDNAIKYSAPSTTVKLTVRQNSDMIETIVQDTGVGIPENAIDKLFTKFYRSHRTRLSHRGTGLGLYMSKSIVEAHGGSIWVHSKEGEGSTFGFLLPVYNKDKQPHLSLESNSKITRGVHGWIKNHSLYRG